MRASSHILQHGERQIQPVFIDQYPRVLEDPRAFWNRIHQVDMQHPEGGMVWWPAILFGRQTGTAVVLPAQPHKDLPLRILRDIGL